MHLLLLLAIACAPPPPHWGSDVPMQVAVERFVYQATKPKPPIMFNLERVLDRRTALAVRALDSDRYTGRQLAIDVLSDSTNVNALRAVIWGAMPEYRQEQGKSLCEYILYSVYACADCRGTGICQACDGSAWLGNAWCLSCIGYHGRGTSPCGLCNGSGLPPHLAPKVLEQEGYAQ